MDHVDNCTLCSKSVAVANDFSGARNSDDISNNTVYVSIPPTCLQHTRKISPGILMILINGRSVMKRHSTGANSNKWQIEAFTPADNVGGTFTEESSFATRECDPALQYGLSDLQSLSKI